MFDHLPRPAEKRVALHVKPAAERALRKGHPWLFEGAIRKQSHDAQAGDLAVIFDTNRRFLAIGLYDPDSPIRVKVLQHRDSATINRDFFHAKIAAAAQIRAPLAEKNTTGYRLIHGENDGLPGLVVDRYAATLVMKLYTAAWIPHLRDVVPALLDVQPATRLILRLSRNITADLRDGDTLIGTPPDTPIAFTENGLTFSADVVHGHKTGFFFDHRENRERVGALAKGKRVLDVFAYAGAFSVYAARGGAESVLSMDISAPALDAARHNFALNTEHVAGTRHEVMVADAFAGLHTLAGQTFDLVVIDPPSFAKSEDEVAGALRAYATLTDLALPLVASGGDFVIASCSSRVSPDAFFDAVLRGRALQVIERTGHALDHPVGFPEGRYLKCLFARVP